MILDRKFSQFWHRNVISRNKRQSPLRVTYFSRAQNALREKNAKLLFLMMNRKSKSGAGLEDAARNIEAVCYRKKKREKKHVRTRAGYSRGHSLNGSTILGHSSKRHNASSMTGNAWFWWNQVRPESRIKPCTGAMKSSAIDTVCSHTSI